MIEFAALEDSTIIGGFITLLVLAFLRFGNSLVNHYTTTSSPDAIIEAVLQQD